MPDGRLVIKNYNTDMRHRGSMSVNPMRSAPLIGASYMSFAMLMGAGIDISVKALAADYATAQNTPAFVDGTCGIPLLERAAELRRVD